MKKLTESEIRELDRLFADTANRVLGAFYYCKIDPRLIAPARVGIYGYQINFAHKYAMPVLLVYLGILLLPLALVLLFTSGDLLSVKLLLLLVFAGSVVVLIVLSLYLSRRATG